MKIKEGFLVKNVADTWVVVPTGDTLDLNMMITLNETARFLWQCLSCETTPQALVEALLSEYDVSEETARSCVENFVERLKENDLLQC